MASEGLRRDACGNVMLAQIPNGLSALRFALAAIWIELAAHGHQGRLAFAIIAIVAAGSDFIDGRIARRLGVASGSGRWLDGIADVTFVLAALFCEAATGALPFYIPILIALSFSQYAIDSLFILQPATGPIRSRLGIGRDHQLCAGDHARNRAAACTPRRDGARPRATDRAVLRRRNLRTCLALLPPALMRARTSSNA